jgi:purine-nucleoside phosphorylase
MKKPASPTRVPDPKASAAVLFKRTATRPNLGIILGSGFHGVADLVDAELRIPYRQIPGFPTTAVPGHEGALIVGHVGNVPVAILSGRSHFYEGHTMEAVTFPVRVLAEFGVRDLVLTNAAGGINPNFAPGNFMLVSDHINFMGVNALRGPLPPGRQRFVDMTRAYDPRLSALFRKAARLARVPLREGVYVAVPGPCYETPAEIRAFAILGGDAVGMSTVPEVAVGRQCQLNVAAISCITNLAAGRGKNPISHEEVLAVGHQSKTRAARLLARFIKVYADPQLNET